MIVLLLLKKKLKLSQRRSDHSVSCSSDVRPLFLDPVIFRFNFRLTFEQIPFDFYRLLVTFTPKLCLHLPGELFLIFKGMC